jgi:hypothetical protein
LDKAHVDCPDTDTLAARLSEHGVAVAASVPLDASVRWSGVPGALVADIDIRYNGESIGTRHLTSATNDCATLAAATIVALAIALSDEEIARLRAPLPASLPEQRPTPALHFSSWSGGALFAYGNAPAPLYGLYAAWRATLGQRWRIGAEARGFFPAETSFDGGAFANSGVVGRGFGCFVLRRGIEACAFGEGGAFFTWGVRAPISGHPLPAFYFAVGPALRLALAATGPFGFELSAAMPVPLSQMSVVIDDNRLWKQPPVTVVLSLGATLFDAGAIKILGHPQ